MPVETKSQLLAGWELSVDIAASESPKKTAADQLQLKLDH
jgi:hypothetical protein